MHPTVVDRLAMRERARALGDTNLEIACNADLVRYGYRDDDNTTGGLETTEMVAQNMETAVPEPPKRGRKPLPRCEHNQIVGRCDVCEDKGEQHG